MDPGRLAITVDHAGGRSTRWGYDEVDTGTIPNDLSFSTSVPGGFKDASCSLLRELEPRPDEGLFDTLRVYGPGNQTAWEGRIAQLPRQTGPNTLQPGAVGWSSHLTDNETFMMVYVAYGPDGWDAPSLVRQVQIAAGGGSQGAVPTTTAGGLSWSPTAGQVIINGDSSELVFTAPPGAPVASMQYVGIEQGTWTNFDGPILYRTDDPAINTAVTNTSLTLDGTNRSVSFTASRYLMLRAKPFANTTPGTGLLRTYGPIAVYGNHGLTLRTTSGGNPDGIYASDAIAHIVATAAPMLNTTLDSIDATTYAIPHLAFTEPTTAADAIATANAYHNWDWAVWDNRTFYYTPAGAGVEWQARIGDGASLSLEGDTAEQIINGVVISYTDGGARKFAGPTGSGLDVESAALEDTDGDNPANSHSIPAKWPVISLSFPTTDAGAVELGSIYLAERNLASRRGQATLTGEVRHPQEGMVPVWRVRAGDTIRLTDRPGDPARRVIETSYSHASRQVTLSLDSTAHKLDALLERVAVYTGALTT
jgi:hypothetical protein